MAWPSSRDDSKAEDIIKQRKEEGIDVVLRGNVDARETSTLLQCVHLLHNALPEINMDEVDLSTTFLGHRLGAPLVIDSMTGGAPMAEKVNGVLATVAEEMNLAMGVGSQRAGLISERMAATYSITRKNAPTAFIFANIGGAQLAKGFSTEDAKKLVEMIKADALAVHLNPLQEVVQPEGEPIFKGVLKRIAELVREVGVPVIVKEVGAGISSEVAVKLEMAGVRAINVSGAGGTSWAAVEKVRAEARSMGEKAELGDIFWDWGIPTAAALINARKAVRLPLIASGGLRNGLDVAKCLALGADACGMASPMIKRAAEGKEAAAAFASSVALQLRTAMFITGANDLTPGVPEGDASSPRRSRTGWRRVLVIRWPSNFNTEIARIKKAVDELILNELLPDVRPRTRDGPLLYKMMRDYPKRPAKGLRPFIGVLLPGVRRRRGDALVTAASIELFQNWILIHDDLEDASEMRRGLPVLHRLYDPALAMNAGDALHARMWAALFSNSKRLGDEEPCGC